jgi:hypothetical protein
VGVMIARMIGEALALVLLVVVVIGWMVATTP